jgi:hypothetical protein
MFEQEDEAYGASLYHVASHLARLDASKSMEKPSRENKVSCEEVDNAFIPVMLQGESFQRAFISTISYCLNVYA